MPDRAPIPTLRLEPLTGNLVGSTVEFLDTVESTNDRALACGVDGAVIVAEQQTLGRGRHGNTWHSAPGLGLWFSVALKGPSRGLMFAASLAVREAAMSRAALSIKWPNDLICAGKKVCGILVEHREGWSAVGIGINVHHRLEDFPESLRALAGSLESTTGVEWDRSVLLWNVLERIDDYVRQLRRGGFDDIRAFWSVACQIVGQTVCREGLTGRVVAIDEEGALLVETPGGRRERIAHEVEILP